MIPIFNCIFCYIISNIYAFVWFFVCHMILKMCNIFIQIYRKCTRKHLNEKDNVWLEKPNWKKYKIFWWHIRFCCLFPTQNQLVSSGLLLKNHITYILSEVLIWEGIFFHTFLTSINFYLILVFEIIVFLLTPRVQTTSNRITKKCLDRLTELILRFMFWHNVKLFVFLTQNQLTVSRLIQVSYILLLFYQKFWSESNIRN